MIKDDSVYLDHIIESFEKISDYLRGVSYSDFIADEEKQDAVIRKLEVAGEATKRLSPEFRESYTDINWRAIAGMRDKLIHDYLDVDLDTVWETAINDIPNLLPALEAIKDNL